MLYDGSVDQDILDAAEHLGVICIQVEPEYLVNLVTTLEADMDAEIERLKTENHELAQWRDEHLSNVFDEEAAQRILDVVRRYLDHSHAGHKWRCDSVECIALQDLEDLVSLQTPPEVAVNAAVAGDWCSTHERPRCRPGPGTTSDGRHCGAHSRDGQACVFVDKPKARIDGVVYETVPRNDTAAPDGFPK